MKVWRYVTAQARADWERYARHAQAHGFVALVNDLAPKKTWGFRRIDRRIMQLRKELELRGLSCKLEW
jgi:Ser-tRNA(Ala) deacylase AlaX